tara:strand:- start:391 stop:1248 length:858 start_codon:yes stop_codon:yes gene_type:complete
MTETVMVKEEPKKVAFMKRKNANENRIEKDEQELKELLDNKNEEPTEEVKEEEPVNAEEKSFKKRYGDLRRHMQQKEKDWEDKFKNLEKQLKEVTQKEIRLPKSDEDIEAWTQKHPDVAAIVETIAIKKAKEQAAGLEDKVKEIDEMRVIASREKAEAELMQIHPDFVDIRNSDDFHEWADEQPKWVQDALYENDTDSRSAARAIDLYKSDRNIKTKKVNSSKDAAKSVNSRTTRSEPATTDTDGAFKESQVAKMTAEQYEKAADAIMESIRSGKFVYDLSGSAR